ncbi:uncharacterized protein [Aegilops tauschii subsp. strangulata]|uniref:uncharacterized protein n=1 Tax=Aegilops tauschii subsp. strangulata TaxID=200361 RepID=UPI00098BAEA8
MLLPMTSAPVAKLRPLGGEEGVCVNIDVVRLLGTPWRKNVVSRRPPCPPRCTIGDQEGRLQYSSGSRLLYRIWGDLCLYMFNSCIQTMVLRGTSSSVEYEEGHNHLTHSQPALKNYWYMHFMSTIVIPYVLDGKLILRFGQSPAASVERFSADGKDLR